MTTTMATANVPHHLHAPTSTTVGASNKIIHTSHHRRPWQVDWKDPQWTFQQQDDENEDCERHQRKQQQHDQPSRQDDEGELVVVNATTCMVTKHDIPQYILNKINEKRKIQQYQVGDADDDENDDGDWLLSVRLLSSSSSSSFVNNQSEKNKDDSNIFIASHVQIEILRMASPVSNDHADSSGASNYGQRLISVLKKQLQWPETIDNDLKTDKHNDQQNTSSNKNKNWFISKLWKPLLGEIDEEEITDNEKVEDQQGGGDTILEKAQNDTGQVEERNNLTKGTGDDPDLSITKTNTHDGGGGHDDQIPHAGVAVSVRSGDFDGVSTIDGEIENDHECDDDDFLFLQKPFLSRRGIVSATFCRRPKQNQNEWRGSSNGSASSNAERSHAADTIQMMNLGFSSESSMDKLISLPSRSNDSEGSSSVGTLPISDGMIGPNTAVEEFEIHLICINHTGNVYVYNPWVLLLPPPQQHHQQPTVMKQQQKNYGDDFAQLLFGQTLFQTLQQTWKPLSEPISTTQPGVFLSTKAFSTSPTVSVDHSGIDATEDTGLEPPSTISHTNNGNNTESQSGGDGEIDEEHVGLDGSTTSEHSVGTSQLGDTRTTATTHTSRRPPNRKRYRKQRRQKNINPFFLWNPTFDSTTIKDATTINNQPISVHPAGSSYIAILGRGIHVSRQGGNNEALEGLTTPSSNERPWWEKSSDNDAPFQDDGLDTGDIEEQSAGSRRPDEREAKSTSSEPTLSQVRRDERRRRKYRQGGFVTFLSTAHWSETRTLFLPFPPVSASFLAEWMGAEWLLITGKTQCVLVRMDVVTENGTSYTINQIAVPIGSAFDSFAISKSDHTYTLSCSEIDAADFSNASHTASTSSKRTYTDDDDDRERLLVNKYQILSIDIEVSGSIEPRLLCGPVSRVDPPSILELYIDNESDQQRALVLLKSFSHFTSKGTIALTHRLTDVAKITFRKPIGDSRPSAWMNSNRCSWWCQHGQGWSTVGNCNHVFFICWEGSTIANGAYVNEIPLSLNGSFPVICQHITSLSPSTRHNEAEKQHNELKPTIPALPFSSLLEDIIGSKNARESQKENVTSDMIFEAYDELSRSFTGSDGDRAGYSANRESESLLLHCTSWTQLENTVEDKISLRRQYPLLAVHAGSASSPHRVFSIRKVVHSNGAFSPFQQVLGWLAQRGDYFEAASLALDLLNDSDCLFHLWRNAAMIDEADGISKLEGLLDGIAPVKLVRPSDGELKSSSRKKQDQLFTSHLADMTIGCMVKGGYSMSRTLRRFLANNQSYDPSRASLMLAATAAFIVSGDSSSTPLTVEGDSELSNDELMWPIQCLLEVGTSRNYLGPALKFLNMTIPDELRNRVKVSNGDERDDYLEAVVHVTQKIVELIVASDATSQEILFDLEDSQTAKRYWESLDPKTRHGLALIEIDTSYPLLRNPEVRLWLRSQLDSNLNNKESQSSQPSSEWLQRLCMACLTNGGWDTSALEINDRPADATKSSLPDDLDGHDDNDDGLQQLRLEINETWDALSDASIDFDILIPSLLLLYIRKESWFHQGQYAPTQSLLNAVCHMAGRNIDDYAFFDGSTCMKYCFLANNIEAGAYLIGGKDGFTLQCSHILMNELSISMSDAENIIICDHLDQSYIAKLKGSSFELRDSHRKLLWLLDEHVLNVRTFGEFDTVHSRGRVDPVFAAKSIFRTWLAITHGDLGTATGYLDNWLSRRLEIEVDDEKTLYDSSSAGSSRRLACAALAQALLFSATQVIDGITAFTNGSDPADQPCTQTLAEALGMKKRLLIDICQSCCGIVHSIPPIDFRYQNFGRNDLAET